MGRWGVSDRDIGAVRYDVGSVAAPLSPDVGVDSWVASGLSSGSSAEVWTTEGSGSVATFGPTEFRDSAKTVAELDDGSSLQ